MYIRILLLMLITPLHMYSQELHCEEINEPVMWLRHRYLTIDPEIIGERTDSAVVKCSNFILPMTSNQFVSDTVKNISLKLIEGDLKPNEENNNCVVTLLVINNTDSLVEVETLDGILLAVAEIYYNEKWYPIEYFIAPECGNSYLNIPLKSRKCYKVSYEKYLGKSFSKLRYKMKFKGKYIVSNSIDSKFNIEQLILDDKQIDDTIINFKD